MSVTYTEGSGDGVRDDVPEALPPVSIAPDPSDQAPSVPAKTPPPAAPPASKTAPKVEKRTAGKHKS